jgi:hypothetical protein
MSGLARRYLSHRRLAGAAALACAIATATMAHAKHAAPQDDPDPDSQNSPAPADSSAEGHGVVITGQFVESHDLLSDAADDPTPVSSAIQWSHGFTIVLSGKNHVSEKWDDVRTSAGVGAFGSHNGGHRKNRGLLTRTGENSVTIGAESGRAIWHVLGEKKLQRIFPGQRFLMIMNFEIGADNNCNLEVKYPRQVGFTSVVMRKATDGTLANFSLPRVESASCAIR